MISSLFKRLAPGAVALAALLFVSNWMLRADPKPGASSVQVEPTSFQSPAAAPAPQPVYQAPSYASAPATPAGQLVCGACGELLQTPQPVLIAAPLQGHARAPRAVSTPRPAPAQYFYPDQAAPAAYYPPQPVVYVMPEAIDELGYRPGAPIASVFPLSTNFRLPAQYIPPYSDAQVRAWRRAHAHAQTMPVRW